MILQGQMKGSDVGCKFLPHKGRLGSHCNYDGQGKRHVATIAIPCKAAIFLCTCTQGSNSSCCDFDCTVPCWRLDSKQ